MTSPASRGHDAPCAEVRARLYEFLDRELPVPDRDAIDAHLAACPPCGRLCAFERAFLAVVERRSTIDQAPIELRERIRLALAARERSRPPS